MTSDTGSVDLVCNGFVQRRHHYHLVNKKHVLPFGHLELNNNHSLNILVTAMPIRNHCNKTLKKIGFYQFCW